MTIRNPQNPASMTNGKIVTEHARHSERQSEIAAAMINDGFGHLRPSDMRDDPDVHPLARENLALMDRCRALGIEADMRYGPGLIILEHLVTSQGKRYRRIKSETKGAKQ